MGEAGTEARSHRRHKCLPGWLGMSLGFAACVVCFVAGILSLGYLFGALAVLQGSVDTGKLLEKPRPEVGHHAVATWTGPAQFHEAPMLAERVAEGLLPPVAERLPAHPMVIIPPEKTGIYGGTWDQFSTSARGIGAMASAFAEGLIEWDPLMRELRPGLAQSWEVKDDGRRFVFHLRPRVRWSDGEPFTSADIAFWYEHVLKNTDLSPVPPAGFSLGGKLADFEAPDDHTVVFTFDEPNGLFLRWMARQSSIMLRYPAHYFRQFHPDFIDEVSLRETLNRVGFPFWYQYFDDRAEWRNADLPTLNPWMVERPPPALRVIFTRNPYYWKVDPAGNQLPYIDRVAFQVSAQGSINLNFINGEAGMQSRFVETRDYPLLVQHQHSGNYRVLEWITDAGTGVIMPNLNHRDPAMRALIGEKDFRRALSLAINRDEINQIVYFGMGEPRQMAPLESSPLFDSELATLDTEYNPAEANRLLDSLGLKKRNREGMRLLPDGQPLRLTIEMFDLIADMETLLLVVEYWREVGIQADVRQFARALFYARMPGRLHDMAMGGNSAMIDPLLNQSYFMPLSTGARHALAHVSWFISGGAAGEEPPPDMRRIGELYRKIEHTADEEEQNRLAREILRIHAENRWLIGILGPLPALTLVRDDFLNVPDTAVIPGTRNLTAPEIYAIDNGGERNP